MDQTNELVGLQAQAGLFDTVTQTQLKSLQLNEVGTVWQEGINCEAIELNAASKHEFISKVSIEFDDARLRYLKIETSLEQELEAGFRLQSFTQGSFIGDEEQPIVGFWGTKADL
jgi:hypothetical protein